MVRIQSVEVLDQYRVMLGFTDGSSRVVDLDPFLHGPVFEPLRSDLKRFREVFVDEEAGTIAWPNGADIDPDVLFYGLEPGGPMPAEWIRDSA